MNPAADWAAKVDKAAARVATRRMVHVPFKHNLQTLRHEAWCPKCLRLVAFVTDEALHQYPDQVSVRHQVLHRCPCTCEQDPYTCPVGRQLATAIHDRKGNQEHVRTA